MRSSLGLSFDAVPGFDVRGSVYLDRIPADSGNLRERDVAVSSTYVRSGAELRGEWSRLGHKSLLSGIEYATTGWYILGSHRLPGRAAAVRPYVLVEKLNAAEGEAFLEGAPDESGWAAGLRSSPASRIEKATRIGGWRCCSGWSAWPQA